MKPEHENEQQQKQYIQMKRKSERVSLRIFFSFCLTPYLASYYSLFLNIESCNDEVLFREFISL